jgi:cob(I)alamin adenosyltransferase
MVDDILKRVQSELIDLGKELLTRRGEGASNASTAAFSAENLTLLEKDLQELGGRLPPQTDVLLPGGHFGAGMLHVARAMCRKVERRTVPLARIDRISGNVLRYLNRLGTLLFILARSVNHSSGHPEPAFRTLPERTMTD